MKNMKKIEAIIWWIEKYISIVLIGSILMIIASQAEQHISDFYPWDFVAGGVWMGYCNWRRKLRG